ncbi:hypothetical protein RhiirC2_820673 [Rhizophagus irregularis]|uniref:Uncharacterized protein n=1 Tax=Rhizophagus irregularis TaxID=588596 RepID=A0A2N1NL06_9GLOM|nr:hypothetical protein RhiirC2_820673 [Rhizophagus irregularis]
MPETAINFRPYIRINSNRQVLKINIVICLDQNVTNIIPKIGSPLWNDLNSRNMIKKNIEIPTRSSPAEIYDLINQLFPDHLNGQRLCLFNSSSGILKEVSYNEITCDLIKRNLTKTKKMYIAPGAIDIPETYYVPVFDIPDAFNITGAFDDIPDAFNVTGAFDDIPDAPNVTDAFDVPDAIDVLAFDVLDAFNDYATVPNNCGKISTTTIKGYVCLTVIKNSTSQERKNKINVFYIILITRKFLSFNLGKRNKREDDPHCYEKCVCFDSGLWIQTS